MNLDKIMDPSTGVGAIIIGVIVSLITYFFTKNNKEKITALRLKTTKDLFSKIQGWEGISMSKNIIKTESNHGLIVQDSSVIIKQDMLLSISNLLKNGETKDAQYLLDSLSKAVVGHHPLYPHYLTKIENINGQLVFISKPNSNEAIEKYPIKYKGKVEIPKEYQNFSSMHELSNYADRNQISIDLNLLEFKKFLGDIPNPYQELDGLIKKNGQPILRIIPKEFPPQFLLKLF